MVAIEVVCPRCKAAPGERCQSMVKGSTRWRPNAGFHLERKAFSKGEVPITRANMERAFAEAKRILLQIYNFPDATNVAQIVEKGLVRIEAIEKGEA